MRLHLRPLIQAFDGVGGATATPEAMLSPTYP